MVYCYFQITFSSPELPGPLRPQEAWHDVHLPSFHAGDLGTRMLQRGERVTAEVQLSYSLKSYVLNQWAEVARYSA